MLILVAVKKENGYTLNYTTVKDLCPSPVKTNGFRNSPIVEQTSITGMYSLLENKYCIFKNEFCLILTFFSVKDITNTEPLENTELSSVADDKMTDSEDIER